ncbi:hypothetical protein SAMN05216316_0689 [Nitrosovibrio sp. Nv6]|nr:hypothetical protein SAMN05216316_0689 [Nitrosovibrio sp. Nv6]
MPDRLIRVAFMWGDSLLLAALAFFGASFAGLATQLRSGNTLTRRTVAATMLNSGFIGAIIALLGYQTFAEDLPYLMGMSLLAGIGGATILDFALLLLKRRMGITIRIEQDKGE